MNATIKNTLTEHPGEITIKMIIINTVHENIYECRTYIIGIVSRSSVFEKFPGTGSSPREDGREF